MTSKAEYLKKYMSNDADEEKKKKKKKKKAKSAPILGLKIIDDDADTNLAIDDVDEDKFDLDEERPTIAGMVDERPDIVQKIEAFTSNDKWRRLETRDDATNNVNSKANNANRRRRHDDDDDDDDKSPTRKKAKSDGDDEDASPPRRARGRHDSDSDGVGSKDKTNGIGRRKRHDSDSDGGNDSDNSPPRKKGKSDDDDDDNSPPRRKKGDESENSPVRRRNAAEDSDNSPPRRKNAAEDSDNSPPRRKNAAEDSDNSPPRRKNAAEDSDNSPVRRRKGSESDNSPPRRGGGGGGGAADEASNKKATHTSRGLKAGLQSAKDMRKENEKIKRKEDKAFAALDSKKSGRDAATVVREKGTGKRRDLEAEKKEKEEKEKKEAERKAKYERWGKGMAQAQDRRTNVEETMHEMSKPLNRMKDDQDLDALLKDRVREDDPMLAFIAKKKTKASANKGPQLPIYKGSFPPNRFNIRPGYRWDGVDRSNGFEKSYYSKQADRTATSYDAFKWSTEEM